MTAVSTAQERLPGEIPLKWDRGDILNRPLPTIQEVVRSIQSPDVQPLVGFRFYGATRNHYAPSWSRDGKSLCCLRSDLNLHTCKLLLFTHLDQPQPTEVYSEVFTFEHMHAWSNTLHTTLLFSSNNEESREENLHFLDLNRERGTLNIRRMTTGKDAKVLPSFTQHGSELEVVYRQQAKLMQDAFTV